MRANATPWLVGILLLAACSSVGGGGPQPRFGDVPPPRGGERFPNWPEPPVTTLAKLQELDRAEPVVESMKGAGAGVTGASQDVVAFPALHEDMKLKIKPVPESLDGWNNSPRKELAAYALQMLFLEPEDFVVPTTTIRCVGIDLWNQTHHTKTPPTIPGTDCVLITVAFWLKDVTLPDPLYDEQRFLSEPAYAYQLGNFNVLTYLAQHRDNRTGNFLVSTDDADRRVFAIDNGISFGSWIYNWFNPPSYAWQHMQVPAIPKGTAERLRNLEREDLDALAVVSQLEDDGTGVLRLVAPTAPNDPDTGAHLEGDTLQMGLTRSEIDDVWVRIERLREAVDAKDLGTF